MYDRNDAVLSGFVIRASSKKGIVETKSDNDGRYFLSLSTGIYTLSARWEQFDYWYPLRRSSLLIETGGNYDVDLWPSHRILTTSLVVTKRGVSEPTSLAPAPQYQEYSFSEQKKIKLIIQFSKSDRQRSKLQNVILTYNRYTIHADVAEVDGLKREIILKGTVRFFGHTKMIRSDHATLRLERKRPILSIEEKLYSLAPEANNDDDH